MTRFCSNPVFFQDAFIHCVVFYAYGIHVRDSSKLLRMYYRDDVGASNRLWTWEDEMCVIRLSLLPSPFLSLSSEIRDQLLRRPGEECRRAKGRRTPTWLRTLAFVRCTTRKELMPSRPSYHTFSRRRAACFTCFIYNKFLPNTTFKKRKLGEKFSICNKKETSSPLPSFAFVWFTYFTRNINFIGFDFVI